MKASLGILRKGGIVTSNTTGKSYPVTAIKAFGSDIAAGTKEYTRFLECVPRSVFITAVVNEGVRIEIGVCLNK